VNAEITLTLILSHQRERKFLKPQSAYFRAQKILTIDGIATSSAWGGLLAMTNRDSGLDKEKKSG